jgi:hypothetical protein
MVYDTTNAPPTISYSLGSGSGLDSLVVSFCDPSSLLLGEFTDVLAGDVKYSYLALSFGTASLTFSGVFDFGQDTATAGQYYWGGTVGSVSQLIGVPAYVNLDSTSATVIQVNAVPEPASCALAMALGLLGVVACGRRKMPLIFAGHGMPVNR